MNILTKQEIKQAILHYIASNKGTTFVELERLFERLGHDYQGDFEYTLLDENHVLWLGWDIELFNLISSMKSDGLIEFNYVQPFIYYIDGKVPNLPVAKTARRKKNQHWIPVTITATYMADTGSMTLFDALDVLVGRGGK